MKKTIRFLSLFLVVALIVVAIPFTAAAKELSTTETTLKGVSYKVQDADKLVLKLDNLADSTNEAAENASTWTNAYSNGTSSLYDQNSNMGVNGDSIVASKAITAASNISYIKASVLPMSAETRYVITFSGTVYQSETIVYNGFTFAMLDTAGNGNMQTVMFDGKGGVAMVTGSGFNTPTYNPIGFTNGVEHEFIVEIDGTVLTLYIDGVCCGAMTLDSTKIGSYLALGIRGRVNAPGNVAVDDKLATMRNICVYEDTAVIADAIETNTLDDALLFSADNLAGTNKVSNNAYAITGSWNRTSGDESLEGDSIVTSQNTGVRAWQAYAVKTNLPLNKNSKYLITFDGVLPQHFDRGGFIFTIPTSYSMGNVTELYFNDEKTVCLGKGYDATGTESYDVSSVDLRDEHSYLIAINGSSIQLMIDGNYVGSMTLSEDVGTAHLDFGFAGSVVAIRQGAIATMKNIKVYGGVLEASTRNGYTDGDVLLKLDNFDETTASSDFEDISLIKRVQNSKLGDTDKSAVCVNVSDSTMTNAHVYQGVETNLPLTETSKYTIDLYVNNVSNTNLGITFAGNGNGTYQGIYFYPNSITPITGTTADKTQSFPMKNLWSAYRDNDGYTHLTVEVNGYTATAYVGGVIVGTVSFNSYTSANLIVGIRAVGVSVETEPIANVKDITVYAGNIKGQIKSRVQFVKDGELLESDYAAKIGDVIEAFPTVEVEEDEVVAWFYKGTNAMVLAPYTVVSDVTIEARVFKKDAFSTVVGMQYTEASNNTQSVRFISILDSLKGSQTGFEIIAKYMDGEELKELRWDDIRTNYVYSSINATTNGTVKSISAAGLGGTYLSALAVDDVPTNIGQIDFYVRSYVTVNGENNYSGQVCFTLYNGVKDSTRAPLEA